jgi:hypothetical protein
MGLVTLWLVVVVVVAIAQQDKARKLRAQEVRFRSRRYYYWQV